jgi:hypothetical protein
MGQREDDVEIARRQKLALSCRDPSLARLVLAFRAMPVTASNGEISITCVMGSISLWGVGRLNDARSNGRTRVQLTIKIWRTLPSEAQ